MSKSVKSRLGKLISYLINPLVLPPILIGLAADMEGAASSEVWSVVGVAAVFFCLGPLIYLLILVKSGAIGSLEARDQSRRNKPLLWGTVFFLLSIPALGLAAEDSRGIVVMIASISTLNVLLLGLVTRTVKISLHAASMAGVISILAVLQWLTGSEVWGGNATILVMLFLLPVVMWGRTADLAHTSRETLLGAVFGFLVPTIEIVSLHIMGMDF